MNDFLIGCVIGAAAWYFVRCLVVLVEDRAARRAKDKARAALADRFRNRLKEPPAAPSVPAGWRLVPVEPTREMREAGERALCSWLAPALHAADAYRAMIDAAPSGEESK